MQNNPLMLNKMISQRFNHFWNELIAHGASMIWPVKQKKYSVKLLLFSNLLV